MIRTATLEDAAAIAAIYAPIVRDTTISFELQPPTTDEMRARIESTLRRLPWLVSLDAAGAVNGYAYAGKHRDPGAYQWSALSGAARRAGAAGLLSGLRRHRVAQCRQRGAARVGGL
jgi:L-amino acid N-acyltransferase YncA